MVNKRKSLVRTVFYDEVTKEFCSCEGDFWKTCSLRVINRLPCTEAIVSLTPIERTDKDPAEDTVRSLDEELSNLAHQLRHVVDFHKI